VIAVTSLPEAPDRTQPTAQLTLKIDERVRNALQEESWRRKRARVRNWAMRDVIEEAVIAYLRPRAD